MDDIERFRTAQRLVGAGDGHSAVQVLEPLLGEDAPSSVLLLAGRAAFATAQLGRAEDCFRRLVERDPADHYAQAALGRTLARRSRHAEALPHLRLATALDPEPWYAEALASAQAALGRAG